MVTSAFVGAGVVAIGAASNLPDAKAVSPTVLQGLENSSVTADGLAERAADNEARTSRDDARGAKAGKPKEAGESDVWLLPLDDYQFTSPFGVRWGELHAGIDLVAEEGTPYKAVHAGVVTKAGYYGGYGYAVTVRHPNGTEVIYGHSRKLYVHKGQRVNAGEILGEVGSTGYTFGTHLHIEVHVKGTPRDPVPLLRANGVDIKLQVETVYSNLDAS